MSLFFHQWQQLMGTFKLLGDSAYDADDFPFIITPKNILMLRKQLEIYNCVKVKL